MTLAALTFAAALALSANSGFCDPHKSITIENTTAVNAMVIVNGGRHMIRPYDVYTIAAHSEFCLSRRGGPYRIDVRPDDRIFFEGGAISKKYAVVWPFSTLTEQDRTCVAGLDAKFVIVVEDRALRCRVVEPVSKRR